MLDHQNGAKQGAVTGLLSGTLVLTRDGEKPAETLRPGDMVTTRDSGYVSLRWIGASEWDAHVAARAEYAPVRIPRGALGRGMPERDLYVAPDHRIWLRDPSFSMHFRAREVLIPARHLVGWKGIEQVGYVPAPVYVHLLFDRHEIVFADGMQCESHHPDQDASVFADGQSDAMSALFPGLLSLCSRGAPARISLDRNAAKLALKSKFAA
ncbi:Hint domain-containing protein [Shimia biformata]|uniref:Hint domain-containing protein n=1 Tax=Shimia biformata TaxID=1294299 RepID=UPI00194E62DD|nr:Hint domain-containing protein [Shimia biformata]